MEKISTIALYSVTHGYPLAVTPEYSIVSSFWSVLAIVKLQFSHNDGAGHRHGETQQSYPTSAVQQCGFQADLCSMTNEYGMCDSNQRILEESVADITR